MLRFLNQRKKSQKVIWIIASSFIILGMVVFYAPSRNLLRQDRSQLSDLDESILVARVNKQDITAKEYTQGLNNMMRAYQNFFAQQGGGRQEVSYSSLKNMGVDKTLLKSLIRKKIISLEVARLNLQPTDEELKSYILQQFRGTDGRWVGNEKYQRFIERSGQTVLEFENGLREQISEEKLRSFVTGTIEVSPQEVQDQFNKENTNFDLNYVVLDPSKLTDKVVTNDADLKTYFDAHKKDFHIDKTQRQVEYIFISQDSVSKSLQLSDEELKKDYDPEKFVSEIRVSQIMIKALTEQEVPNAQKKAEELVTRARGSNGIQPEDFAALARGNSQDPTTKDKDGDLGYVKKDTIKPGSYLQRALSMKLNDISEPVREGNNFYILKLTDRKNKTFEEAKEGLVASARNRSAYKKAVELAEDAYKQLVTDKKDINAVAADIAQKQGLKVDETLRRPPFFADGDDIPEIGSNPSFEETTSGLKKPGDVGAKVGVRGGFAIPRLIATKEPHDPEFEEVKANVATKYKLEKSKDLAAERAKAIIAAANGTPEGLKTAAEKEGFKVDTREKFADGISLDNFGVLAQVMTTALGLKQGQITKEPLYGNTKYLVFGVTKRTDPDQTKYNEQAKAIEQRLLEERRRMIFDSYLDGIKKQLKTDGKITVYNQAIEQIFAQAKESAGQ